MFSHLSLLDILGAAIGLVYIISEYRASRWFWQSSLLMSLFYIVIDFNSGYYANGSICIYNFVMSLYGLLVWRGVLHSREKRERPIGSCPVRYLPFILLSIVLLSFFFVWLLGRVGESQYPLVDGISSAISIVAMVMLSFKWWQQWICWMIVEPMMVVLFVISGNYASAMLYVVFEVFCILGIMSWRKQSNETSHNIS